MDFNYKAGLDDLMLSDVAVDSYFPGRKILLLQGPVGDFFRNLSARLVEQNAQVVNVAFNGADLIFGGKENRINYRGTLDEWNNWLSNYCKGDSAPDVILMFGSDRPVHKVAREVANILGIDVWCFEEGYVRPGLITMERGGNNANSPLFGKFPESDWCRDPEITFEDARDFNGFKGYCIKSGLYYVTRTFTTFGRRKSLYHKTFNPLVEVFHWFRNVYRRKYCEGENLNIVARLTGVYSKKFYIVPMQIARDCNMGDAAMGWDSPRLIKAVISSFSKSAPESTRLVFKIHPLERGHSDWKPFIGSIAEENGVSDRVDVIDTGSLGELTRHSIGMITVTSTSGLSAIHHGVPLLVVGKAVYAHNDLAVCARGKPDFDSFWASDCVAPEVVRRRYEAWLWESALIPGDYYTSDGIAIACKHAMNRLQKYYRIRSSEVEGTLLDLSSEASSEINLPEESQKSA